MAIRQGGGIIGTIGGGLLEAEVIQLGQEILQKGTASLRSYHFNAKQAGDAGMLCGGQVRVLVQRMDGNDSEQGGIFAELTRALKSGRKAWLVTEIEGEDGDRDIRIAQGVGVEDGSVTGGLQVGGPELKETLMGTWSRGPEWVDLQGHRLLIEPVRSQDTVYIFGAGHISQMLAPLTTWVGFRTVVLDDRADFACQERFATADQIEVVNSFDRAFEGLEIGEDSYLVIVTRGHMDDRTVLAQALHTGAGYIGMIGSQRKRDLIYRSLLEEGVEAHDLARVRSPIGIDIHAETPEEIAISILAELIKARAERG